MDFEFDRGIAAARTGAGEYAVDLDGGWVVGGGVNGGYLLAVIGNAIGHDLATLGQPDPVSVSAYYLTPSVPGPAVVRVQRLREGGRRSTVRASLLQQDEGVEVERIAVLAVYADLGERDDRSSVGPADPWAEEVARQVAAPQLPPLEECVPTSLAPADFRAKAPLLDRMDLRLDPACVGWALGQPSRAGVIQGWFRLVDERDLDPVALLFVVDALPPVTFDLGRTGWAPTLELTAHVRARPAPGWAIVRHATRTVSGGQFEEDCEVWDATGRLVAQSRQLALLPRVYGA